MITAGAQVIYHLLKNQKHPITISDESTFRVMPWHLDLNGHMNNANYFHFCNQARLKFLARSGVLRFVISKRYIPVIKSNKLSYKRSLKLGHSFRIQTVIDSYSDHEIILKHIFSSRGMKYAECMTTAVLLDRDKQRIKDLEKEYHNFVFGGPSGEV